MLRHEKQHFLSMLLSIDCQTTTICLFFISIRVPYNVSALLTVVKGQKLTETR